MLTVSLANEFAEAVFSLTNIAGRFDFETKQKIVDALKPLKKLAAEKQQEVLMR